MKLVILTSDILDGRIVAQELLKTNRDVKAILYEKKHKILKTRIKLLLLFLFGKLKYRSFENMAKAKGGLLVKATDNINENENLVLLKRIKPDLIVVVGTRRLNKEIFDAASSGAINLHSGILPFYRGADSEFWALYNNEPEMVGVTIHFIDEELDAGDIILWQRQTVRPNDDPTSLRKKNIYLGAKKINEAISAIESGDYHSIKQEASYAKTHSSARGNDIKRLRNRTRQWLKRRSTVKLFGNDSVSTEEEVATKPLIEFMSGTQIDYPHTFCLRIDADEYDNKSISSYFDLFKKYRDAITIFINANSFSKAKDKITEFKNIGLDIQSHGFYHYTYKDYESNRHNIRKARIFFEELGIVTKGFAAPTGRWNKHLLKALEDEGYEYSSDFAYDYLGLPSYPSLGKRISRVLEIPIFPVAPELFFQQNSCRTDAVLDYYKNAIDEMEYCGIPVIIYAHTSRFKEVPGLLKDIAEYAISNKGLKPMNMTGFYAWWKERPSYKKKLPLKKKTIKVPAGPFLGTKANVDLSKALRSSLKKVIDFEKITPDEELYCPVSRRLVKRLLRKVL